MAKYSEIKDLLSDFSLLYDEFINKFYPEVFQTLEGEELLKNMFWQEKIRIICVGGRDSILK